MKKTNALLAAAFIFLFCLGCSSSDADKQTGKETFPPEKQTPLYKKGLILPQNSLECVPVSTGVAQKNCNHHGSTVAELPDGTMAAVWYHGEFEKSLDSRIVWSKKAPGTDEWTWPEVLYDDPERSDGNPAVWLNEKGELYVFFPTIFGDGWDGCKIRMIKSLDLGKTWGEPVFLRESYCWNARHRPARMPNGDLLLPLYNECLALPVFMRSSDDFKTWTEEGTLTSAEFMDRVSEIQPSIVVLDDGTVSVMTRDGSAAHRIKRMTSADDGKTFGKMALTGLPNPGSSMDQVKLLDGHVVVVFNNNPNDRWPLSVALSLDGGATFVAIRDINADCPVAGQCSWAYPSIAQNTHDGTVWVTYTHNRETIGWVQFNEAWLAAGGEQSLIKCTTTEECYENECLDKCSVDGDCPDETQSCMGGYCRVKCASGADCPAGYSCETDTCKIIIDPKRVDQKCSK